MLFNSIEFFIFLPIVFLLYWVVGNGKLNRQNWILVISSYFFYAWWDWRFIFLVFFSSALDFFIGKKLFSLDTAETKLKKLYLSISIICNLGLLGFFKYFEFFVDSFIESFEFFGEELGQASLNIILPVGISFYTFQTMSYSIDIYRGKQKAETNFGNFLLYVSFFPQLLAGPIERSGDFLPQLISKRKFEYTQGVDGMRLILWGLLKKVLIADKLYIFCQVIEANFESFHLFTLFVYPFFIAIAVYCDFSGYSDMAVGIGRLFGLRLRNNFLSPFFHRNIQSFWKGWHITLYTWFFDYVGPLIKGFSQQKLALRVVLVFFLSGLWHGPKLHYLLWGLINGFILILFIFGWVKRAKPQHRNEPHILYGILTLGIFAYVGLLYRLDLTDFCNFFEAMLEGFNSKEVFFPSLNLFILLVGLYLIELTNPKKEYPFLHLIEAQPLVIRWSTYLLCGLLLLIYGGSSTVFEYTNF